MATDTLDKKKQDDVQAESPDYAAPLRADILGSIIKSNPNDPNGYLPRMDSLVTAHGAVETMAPESRDYKMAVGATSQPRIPSSKMGSPEQPPEMGGPAPDTSMPVTMGAPAKPQQSLLGRIGHGLAKMGDIAGTVMAPGVMLNIPGTSLNKRMEAGLAERRAERQRALDIQQERADTEKTGMEQKPDLLEAQGELKGRLAAESQAAQDKRLDERLAAQEKMQGERQTQADKAAADREAAAERRQQASFGEQEKLASQREAASDRRLQESLKARGDTATRKDIATHDKQYVEPAEQIERSYQLYREAQDAYNRGDVKTGAASMLALSQHLGTTFGQVKGSRMNRDLIQEHKDAIGIEDKIERFVDHLKTGQELSANQIKEFGDLIGNMRKLTWQIAAKEADRKKVPVDFLPQDLTDVSHEPGQAGGPKVGDVENGYRFKGGNPKSASSWEKVK